MLLGPNIRLLNSLRVIIMFLASSTSFRKKTSCWAPFYDYKIHGSSIDYISIECYDILGCPNTTIKQSKCIFFFSFIASNTTFYKDLMLLCAITRHYMLFAIFSIASTPILKKKKLRSCRVPTHDSQYVIVFVSYFCSQKQFR